jgi:hypothetical protein
VLEVRRISLTLLRIRFLSFALPSLRGVVRPKRLNSNPFGRANTTKEGDIRFAPDLYTFLKSDALLSRKHFGKQFVPSVGTVSNALVMLNRYSLAPFVASGFQHQSPASRLHSSAKTVRLSAAPVVRLICSLRHLTTPLKTLNLAYRV